MALKCFLSTPVVSIATGTTALATVGPVPVLESGGAGTLTLRPSPGEDGTFVASIYAQTTLTFEDDLDSIRSRLTKAAEDDFNTVTGRADGNTITFIWMDDSGGPV